MDKKKLIGTIVGVVAFAALIAGATYAWLTTNATITNGTYNLNTLHFSVDYTQGTDITSIKVTSAPTTSTTSHLQVVAKAVDATNAPGTLKIYLNTDTATASMLTAGSLHYTVCNNTCSQSNLSQETNTGTVTATGKLEIYSGTLPASTATAAQSTYHVYFWLDAATAQAGDSYSGYISAEAIQTG